MAGPSLANIGALAGERVRSPDYRGQATDPAGYIHESIVNPNAFLVPGQNYSSNGQSMMPGHFATTLTPEQIDQLVAYLMSLK